MQADSIGCGALEEGTAAVFKDHRDQRLRIAGVFTPGRVPSLRVDRITYGASQVGEHIELMHRPLDHQRIGNLVPKRRPSCRIFRRSEVRWQTR